MSTKKSYKSKVFCVNLKLSLKIRQISMKYPGKLSRIFAGDGEFGFFADFDSQGLDKTLTAKAA